MSSRTTCVALVFLVVATAGLAVRAAESEASRVKLVIDFGDGVEKHFTRLAWKEGMTVLEAMMAAQQHPRGITFDQRGKRSTAFVYGIDGLQNEARGRGWLYKVNGNLSDRSCGIHTLGAGDTVLWTFEKYR